ncbi:unnamed protein product, partial [Discosporangium mesarthrocarpum]
MISGEWTALGEVQYRKLHVYDLDWGEDEECRLDRSITALAKYGGAIAMVRDETKVLKAPGEENGTPSLRVFSCSGRKLSETLLRGPASSSAGGSIARERLFSMGWTDREMLIMVRERGGVEVRNLQGDLMRALSLMDESSLQSPTPEWVVACEVWGDGVVALLSSGRLSAIKGIHSSQPRCFRMTAGLAAREGPLTAMVVLEPQFTASGSLEVILATENGNAIGVDENGAEEHLLQEPLQDPILKMAAAPNGRFLACFVRGGMLTVVSSNFATKVLLGGGGGGGEEP